MGGEILPFLFTLFQSRDIIIPNQERGDSMKYPFGPMTADDYAIESHMTCPACKEEFKAGDYTVLVPIGPGKDPEAQELCRQGRVHNAIAVQAHWSCVTGEPDPK